VYFDRIAQLLSQLKQRIWDTFDLNSNCVFNGGPDANGTSVALPFCNLVGTDSPFTEVFELPAPHTAVPRPSREATEDMHFTHAESVNKTASAVASAKSFNDAVPVKPLAAEERLATV